MSQNDNTSSVQVNVGRDVEIHDTKDPDAVFITNQSKLELALKEYKDGVLALRAWTNPLVLFLTVLSAILVADFSQTFGLSKSFWEAVFFIALVISFLWLLYSLFGIYRNRGKAILNQ